MAVAVNPCATVDNRIKWVIVKYTRGVWDLGVNARPIYFMARRNDK